jgi:FkbM family methyltransferase
VLTRVVVPIRTESGNPPLYLRCGSSDFATFHEIFINGEYQAVLRHEQSRVRGILDLGANVGLASRWFLKQWPTAFIVAVEPDPDNFRLLQANLSAVSVGSGGSNLVNAFVGAENREAFVNNRGPGWANECTLEDRQTSRDQIPISVISPHRLVNMCPHSIDLVKIDIEGTEKELCEADLDWLGASQLLVMEIHEPLDEKWVRRTLVERMPSWSLESCDCSHGGAHLVVLKRNTAPTAD